MTFGDGAVLHLEHQAMAVTLTANDRMTHIDGWPMDRLDRHYRATLAAALRGDPPDDPTFRWHRLLLGAAVARG